MGAAPVVHAQPSTLSVTTTPSASPAARMALARAVPLATALKSRGDLTLQNATIEKALFAISSSWKVNIVVGKDVQGTVSCVYRQAPLREVLDAILLANGYSYRVVGGSIVVQGAKEVGSANPLFRSVTLPIKHSDLEEIAQGAKLLVSDQGQVQTLESARSLLVVDFADRVATVTDFVARMEGAAAQVTGGIPVETYKRLEVAYFHTQYIPVDNSKGPISAILSKVGRVATMPAENRLIVIDYASNIEMVRKVLAQIDHPRPQIRVTALIYDVSLSDAEQLGVNWNSSGKGNNVDDDGNAQQALTFATQTLTPFKTGTAGGTLTVKSLTRNFDINTIALLLQNANDSRLLADPNVTVVDNETAEWKSVSEIPFQNLTQSSLGGQIGTTAFKEVGITLRVKARVAADATIEMFVEPEFSRLVGFTERDSQPIIDSRSASTVVRIANRQTLVIGGLRQRSDTGDFNGIPFLKDVKYIGPLFRSRDTTVRESELIVFIMPEIINYDQPSAPRQYAAAETAGSRLESIPMAEGLASPNGLGCDVATGEQASSEELTLLPAVDDTAALGSMAAGQRASTLLIKKDHPPLRRAFDDRFHATGGMDARRQRLLESQPQHPATNKDKSAGWKRLFGL